MSKDYFARKPIQDLIKECKGFHDSWSQVTGASQQGIAAVWYRNLKYYYSSLLSGNNGESAMDYLGEQGELVKMLVPQARAMNQQYLSLTTKQKLYFEPEAESTDALTLADTRVAEALVAQEVRDQKVDYKAYQMAEQTSLIGFGYLKPTWDMFSGEPVAVHTSGELVYSGASRIEVPLPTDVIFDFTNPNFETLDWVLVRTIKNKWDLIAKFPHLKDEIYRLQPVRKISETLLFWHNQYNDDYVFVFEFYHRSTPSLPEGRMVVYGDENTVMFDNKNPYKTEKGAYIPVVQMKPEPIMNTGFGYPIFSNILPLQEMLDHNMSALASNNAAFAVKSILNPIGNDISVKNIGQLRFIEYRPMGQQGGGKPETLDLNTQNNEIYKFSDTCLKHMMDIYNINGALRGQPPAGVTSGTAIATLTINALEFSQNFTKSYIDTVERCMTMVIYNYKNFGDESHLISIAGPNGSSISKQFKSSDLASIRRVACKISNPLMASAAGKFQVAENLLHTGLITKAKTYFRILEGAPVETLYDDDFAQDSFIQSENDALRQGRGAKALITDDHAQHMRCHRSLLDDIEVRNNATWAKAVMDHIEEHDGLRRQVPPDWQQIFATGTAPPAPPSPMPSPQMAGAPPMGMHPGMAPPPGGMPMHGAPPRLMQPPPGSPPMGREGEAHPSNPARSPIDLTKIPLGAPSGVTGMR